MALLLGGRDAIHYHDCVDLHDGGVGSSGRSCGSKLQGET